MKPDDFEKRLRTLEYFHALRLIPGAWAVVRVDGRGFSRFTEAHFEKPFDLAFHTLMVQTAKTLLEELRCGRRGDHSPRLRFKTGLATFTASGSWSLPIPWHGQVPILRTLERPPFAAPTDVSSHPLGSLRRLRAYSPLLAARSFRRPSPRQPIRGITPGLCFLGNPSRAAIRLAPALTSQQRGLLRSSRSFCASVGSSYPPGFAGVNLGHSPKCPAPSLVLLDPADTPALAGRISRRFYRRFVAYP
jgi:hypothetical protein